MLADRVFLMLQVHRGVYAAAQILYDRFLPMVQEHIESSPFARVTFTVGADAQREGAGCS